MTGFVLSGQGSWLKRVQPTGPRERVGVLPHFSTWPPLMTPLHISKVAGLLVLHQVSSYIASCGCEKVRHTPPMSRIIYAGALVLGTIGPLEALHPVDFVQRTSADRPGHRWLTPLTARPSLTLLVHVVVCIFCSLLRSESLKRSASASSKAASAPSVKVRLLCESTDLSAALDHRGHLLASGRCRFPDSALSRCSDQLVSGPWLYQI